MRIPYYWLALLIFTRSYGTPSLVIVLKTGLKTETEISQIQRLVFSTTAISVQSKDGKSTSTLISETQKITFSNPTTVKKTGFPFTKSFLSHKNSITIFLKAPSMVQGKILDLNGKHVFDLGQTALPAGRHQISLANPIDETTLTLKLKPGLYLFQVTPKDERTETTIISWP